MDDVSTMIDNLHDEAEELSTLAQTAMAAGRHASAGVLQRKARRKVREAARLRAQIGED